MHTLILMLHVLAATVWTGGHLVVAIRLLPRTLKTGDIEGLLKFERLYEPLGMSALAIQIVTGLWMVHRFFPKLSMWFTLDNDISKLICLKLSLLTATALVAAHAGLRVIPNLSQKNLGFFALHVITVTVLSVGFVIVGVLFRTGF